VLAALSARRARARNSRLPGHRDCRRTAHSRIWTESPEVVCLQHTLVIDESLQWHRSGLPECAHDPRESPALSLLWTPAGTCAAVIPATRCRHHGRGEKGEAMLTSVTVRRRKSWLLAASALASSSLGISGPVLAANECRALDACGSVTCTSTPGTPLLPSATPIPTVSTTSGSFPAT
jgi:hypothetical protein